MIFPLIAKFRAKRAESTSLKNNASVQETASHEDKKQVSFEDKVRQKSESEERKKNLHLVLLELSLRVSIRSRSINIIPVSGQQNRSQRVRKPRSKWQGIVIGERLIGNEPNLPES